MNQLSHPLHMDEDNLQALKARKGGALTLTPAPAFELSGTVG
jgi:hypothetical protein